MIKITQFSNNPSLFKNQFSKLKQNQNAGFYFCQSTRNEICG